jgi:hypothetical protein
MAILDKYGNPYIESQKTSRSSGSSAVSRYGAARGRVSQGAGQVLLGKGGLGFIARRGVDFGTSIALQSMEGVARMATQQPLELLSLLVDFMPEVSLAVWNGTFLGCGPDSVRIKAMTRLPDGGSEEVPEGTAAIADLWTHNSKEVGDLIDALGQNYQMLLFSGLCAAEAVPAARMKGVRSVFPINTLTLRFKRDDDGELRLYQRQTANPNGLGLYSAGFGGFFNPMPMNRVFYNRLPALPDEPYGRAPFGAALTVVIECVAFLRDVMLAFHRVGTPKWDVGVDYEYWAILAKDVIGLSDPKEINQYVQDRQADMVAFYNDLNADDVFFHGAREKVSAVGSGDSWPDLTALWNILLRRLVQAVKQVPTLMGVVDGSTETWSRVQWDIYGQSLKALVSKAVSPLVDASQLHLRLLGMPYIAEAEIAPVKSITRLIDAQTEAIEIRNEAEKRDQGWQSQESAAMRLTGSGPVADAPAARPRTPNSGGRAKPDDPVPPNDEE